MEKTINLKTALSTYIDYYNENRTYKLSHAGDAAYYEKHVKPSYEAYIAAVRPLADAIADVEKRARVRTITAENVLDIIKQSIKERRLIA